MNLKVAGTEDMITIANGKLNVRMPLTIPEFDSVVHKFFVRA